MNFLFAAFFLLSSPPPHILEQWKTLDRENCGQLLFSAYRLKKYQHKFEDAENQLIMDCEKKVFSVPGLSDNVPHSVFLVPIPDLHKSLTPARRALLPAGIWHVGFNPFLVHFAQTLYKGLPEAEKHDQTPDFTFRRYIRVESFQMETRERTDPRRKNRLLVNLTFEQAREICRKEGGDLPTEDQWEIAARGAATFRSFPFGESIPIPCFGLSGPECGTRKSALDISPWGIVNMGSGVAEWVLPSPSRPPVPGRVITRGGTSVDHFYWNLVAARRLHPADTRSESIGFRCVFPITDKQVP